MIMRFTILAVLLHFVPDYVSASVNIALGRTTSMSSQRIRLLFSTASSNAVDGNPDQVLENGHCIETDNNRNFAYWVVSFPPSTINRFRIINRNANRDRLAGFSIFVTTIVAGSSRIFDDHVPVFHDLGPQLPETIVTININDTVTGEFIYVFNNRTVSPLPAGYSSNAILEICEFEAFGCPIGMYGDSCELTCSPFCVENLCNPDTGNCLSGCTPGYLGDACDIPCGNGTFGQNCTQSCNCRFTTCEPASGICNPSSCQIGWQGQSCNDPCGFSMFGYDCNDTCFCASGGCDRFSGLCDVPGCQIGYKGPSCSTPCDSGEYGANCLLCGNCFANETCDPVNGICNNGCQTGYDGDLCQDVCPPGYYGLNCSNVCGACYQGNACDHVTGICPNGTYTCDVGFQGQFCTEACEPGYYGNDCQPCGNCFANESCDPINGTCYNGCREGYGGDICQEVCSPGFYGVSCLNVCGACYQNNTCDYISGICPNDNFTCEIGYKGPRCSEACEPGEYGNDCQRCGNCFKNETCDPVNGTCYNGCREGYGGDFCQEVCLPGYFGVSCLNRCGACYQSNICDYITGICPPDNYTCDQGFKGSRCFEACDPMTFGFRCAGVCGLCANSTCNATDGSCPFGCLPGGEGPLCVDRALQRQAMDDTIITATAGGILSLFVIAIIVIGFIWHKSNRDLEKFRKPPTVPVQARYSVRRAGKDSTYASVSMDNIPIVMLEEGEYEDANYSDEEVYETGTIHDLAVEDLLTILEQNKREHNRQFKDQFKELPVAQMKKCEAAKKPENVSKNRFKTILPYDHSRVELNGDAQNSGYINANFIDGVDSTKNYIASQGPKPSTINDHWQMIWQENVGKIVMLCNIMEDGKAKCQKYWPESGTPLETRNSNITLKDSKDYACYTVRHMTMSDKKTEEERNLVMFHYTQWDDNDVPNALDLVSFHRHIKSIRSSLPGPLLVHCSAGAGRTGTFIAFDALLKQGKRTGKFNVYEYVSAMRKCRMNMIRTPDQYVFLHQVLLEGFRYTRHAVSKKHFQEEFGLINDEEKKKNMTLIRRQFQDLPFEKPVYSDVDYRIALKHEKKTDYKTKGSLPLDKYRPVLYTQIDGGSNYINATFISTYTETNGFIITKLPKKATILDFWRLVYDHSADTIVILGDLEKEQAKKWLPSSTQSSEFGPFEISCVSDTNRFDDITETKLKVCKKEMEPFLVKLLKTKGWFEHLSLPPSQDLLLRLIELVRGWRLPGDKGPILVVSKDGVIGCGIFTAVYNAVEQITEDGEVDLHNIVRKLQIRRPELLGLFEEYQYCFKAVGAFLQSDTVYMNHDG